MYHEGSSKAEGIAADLKKRIRNGDYKDRLPSTRHLATDYGVNFKTVEKAVGKLVAEGHLRREQGRGTFVENRDAARRPLAALLVRSAGHLFGSLASFLIQGFQDAGFLPMVLDPHTPEFRSNVGGHLDGMLARHPAIVVADTLFPQLETRADLISRLAVPLYFDSEPARDALYVLADFWQASHLPTRRLIDHGHRRILYLTHRLEKSPEIYRHTAHYQMRQGYLMTMDDAGLHTDGFYFPLGPNPREDTERLRGLFASPSRPTAILATADQRFQLVYPLLRDLGIRPGTDVECIGMGNTPWCRGMDPPFASISYEEEEIARRIVRHATATEFQPGVVRVEPRLVEASAAGEDFVTEEIGEVRF